MNLLGVSLIQKNHDDTLAMLKEIDQKFQLKLNDLTKVREYAEFVKSPQYKQWLDISRTERQEPVSASAAAQNCACSRRATDSGVWACRLLLRQAVQRAEAEDEVDAVNADDLAVGEELGQGIEGDAVGRIVERRNEHEAVGDVEVGVAGRQPLAVEDDRPGHRQLDDAERLPILVARGLQPAQVVLRAARGSGRRCAARRR